MSKENKNKGFVGGAAVLAAAGLFIKILGAFFRIPLTNIIGDSGMGYYQTAYPIYNLFLSLSTAGIPVAISRMVAERNAVDRPADANKVFKVALGLLAGIGVFSFSIFFFGANKISELLLEPGAFWCIRAIAPAFLVVPIMAAFRGYFQGRQNMRPTAASQFIEQLFRVGIGLALAVILMDKGLEYAAAGASFGASAGGIFGLAVILFIYFSSKKKINRELAEAGEGAVVTESAKEIITALLTIAVPITIGTAIQPIFNTIDTRLVKARLLHIGYDAAASRSLYGQLTGMASPIINFALVIMQAISTSIVPVIASAHTRQEKEFMNKSIGLGMRYVMIVSAPMAVGMAVLSKPIMLLFYPSQRESAISAASCLAVYAAGVIFLGLGLILTGTLQGIGKQNIPVRNLLIGALAKVACTYVLTGIPSINVRGAAVGTVVAYAVSAILNLIAVKKYTGVTFDYRLTLVKPLLSAGVMGAAVFGMFRLVSGHFGNTVSSVISIGTGVVIYLAMILLTNTLNTEELEGLPKGKALVRILRKLHIVK